MIEEINKAFSNLVSFRNWYSETTINRYQANELKRRFIKGELSIGRQIEILIKCGYKVEVYK